MTKVSETLLFTIEQHCNNFFNPHNIPTSLRRDYPPAFLELAERIAEYIEKTPKTHFTSAQFGIQSQAHDLEYTAWEKAFARELSIYKRMKAI